MALPNLVFCDTSFFYACLDPKDTNHAKAQALVTESASIGTTFCTTWDIISETVTLLRYRRNFQAALAFLTDVQWRTGTGTPPTRRQSPYPRPPLSPVTGARDNDCHPNTNSFSRTTMLWPRILRMRASSAVMSGYPSTSASAT